MDLQNALFGSAPVVFDIPDGELLYYPALWEANEAQHWYDQLAADLPWQQDVITVYGKTHRQPRLTALFGHLGKPYAYSSIVMQPHPWTAAMTFLKEKVEDVCGQPFNTVLCNWYQNESDSMGWHADDEASLGPNPCIASLSFGASRMFKLRHNRLPEQKWQLPLASGSLLIMKGALQHNWKHALPKTQRPCGGRINLTFRCLI